MGNNKNMKILCYAVVTAMTFTSIVGPVNVSAAKKAKVAKKTLTITEGKSRKIVIKNKKSKAKYLFKASNAKKAGRSHLMIAQNPVYIFTAQGGAKE